MADGISRKYVNLPTEENDGHTWTVSEDWNLNVGLTHDLFLVTPVHQHETLRTHFQDMPMFLLILDALLELDHGKSTQDKKKARH